MSHPTHTLNQSTRDTPKTHSKPPQSGPKTNPKPHLNHPIEAGRGLMLGRMLLTHDHGWGVADLNHTGQTPNPSSKGEQDDLRKPRTNPGPKRLRGARLGAAPQALPSPASPHRRAAWFRASAGEHRVWTARVGLRRWIPVELSRGLGRSTKAARHAVMDPPTRRDARLVESAQLRAQGTAHIVFYTITGGKRPPRNGAHEGLFQHGRI